APSFSAAGTSVSTLSCGCGLSSEVEGTTALALATRRAMALPQGRGDAWRGTITRVFEFYDLPLCRFFLTHVGSSKGERRGCQVTNNFVLDCTTVHGESSMSLRSAV